MTNLLISFLPNIVLGFLFNEETVVTFPGQKIILSKII
jgi:hypothetical protein